MAPSVPRLGRFQVKILMRVCAGSRCWCQTCIQPGRKTRFYEGFAKHWFRIPFVCHVAGATDENILLGVVFQQTQEFFYECSQPSLSIITYGTPNQQNRQRVLS